MVRRKFKALTKEDARNMLASVETLGQILFAWRELTHSSKSEAARRCGMSPQHWWALENDLHPNPSGETLAKLESGTGIDYMRFVEAAGETRRAKKARSEPVPA